MRQSIQTIRKTICPLCKKETILRWDSEYNSYKGMCNNCVISWYDPRLGLARWMKKVVDSTIILSFKKSEMF